MDDSATYEFTATLWRWGAATKGSWYFVSLPEHVADEIEERFGRSAAGFGSVRVEVTVGETTWHTSIFPSNEERTYVLPVKKAVRAAESLDPDSSAGFALTVLVD